MKRLVVAIAALAAACAWGGRGGEQAPPPAETARPVSGFGPAADWEPIRLSVRAAPLSPSPEIKGVGPLTFRGGLELASDSSRFGGLSGLYVDADGRLLAVTDRGDWFAARLVLDDAGALVGLADGRLAALRDETGAAVTERTGNDAEDITRLPDGRFAVSFEGIHAVRLYDLAGKGPGAAAVRRVALAGVDALTANDSLEAVAALDDDRLLIGSEGFNRGDALFWIAAPDSASPPPPAGNATPTQGYGLVALDRLPGGDFLAMERYFTPLVGPRIVIKRVSAAPLAETPAQWRDAPVAELNPPVTLDNFEGLAIAPRDRGEAVRLYIVSDDNFSSSQKTLLYAFDYVPAP